jgi:hypothetical protein
VAAALLVLTLLFTSTALAPPTSFPDVPPSHAYALAINDLASRGIINGYSDGTFGPNNLVTRQQFAKMIVRSAGYPVTESDVCPFSDVAGSDPTEPLFPDHYIAVAAAHGITEGTSPGIFSPYREITRYQVVTMMVRAADALNPSLLPAPPGSFVGAAGWGGSPTHSANARRAEAGGLLDGLPLGGLAR